MTISQGISLWKSFQVIMGASGSESAPVESETNPFSFTVLTFIFFDDPDDPR